jgi:nickel-dependent lactate racemase
MFINTLPFGSHTIELKLDEHYPAEVINPRDVSGLDNPLDAVKDAVAHPITLLAQARFVTARTAAIAVNDKTRPVPNDILLLPLLAWLESIGLKAEAIQLIIATGTHVPMTADEFPRVLPEEILHKYPVISHDCDDEANLSYLGDTSRGTPVWVNRKYYESDIKIVVGNIEPHHFMGFSGGVKSASIGVAGRLTINRNHAMLVDPMAEVGEYDRNPMRQDIEEIGRRMGVHLALNAILNNDRQIVKVLFGSPLDVMREGISLSRQISQVVVAQPYDLVIASAGGYPKDINLYQAQKAITHGSRLVRDGGVVILAAECPEGSGSASFEDFMNGIHGVEEVFARFKQRGFQVGPHKAFQIAKQAARISIILISSIPSEKVEHFMLIPAESMEAALLKAFAKLPPNPRIAILPHATTTIPQVQST